MKDSQIETEATIALSILRSQLPERGLELATAIVMQNTVAAMCQIVDEVDKGEVGSVAVKSLFRLWKQLNFNDITGENISILRAVVDKMHRKAVKQ